MSKSAFKRRNPTALSKFLIFFNFRYFEHSLIRTKCLVLLLLLTLYLKLEKNLHSSAKNVQSNLYQLEIITIINNNNDNNNNNNNNNKTATTNKQTNTATK